MQRARRPEPSTARMHVRGGGGALGAMRAVARLGGRPPPPPPPLACAQPSALAAHAKGSSLPFGSASIASLLASERRPTAGAERRRGGRPCEPLAARRTASSAVGGGRGKRSGANEAPSSPGEPPPTPKARSGGGSDSEVRQQVEALRAALRTQELKYYSGSTPEISDDQYDALKEKLWELEAQLEQAMDRKRQTVGAPPTSALRKARHLIPMLSLCAVHSADDARAWHERMLRRLPPSEAVAAGDDGHALSWVVEPKIDGLAVSVLYKDGELVRAATRGDGSVGEDVTHNAPAIDGLPTRLTSPADASGARLPPVPTLLEVRGEVFMTRGALDAVNAEQSATGGSQFANSRNAAAGALRLHDVEACRRRRLSFQAYQLFRLPDDAWQAGSPPTALAAANGNGNGPPADPMLRSQHACLQWLSTAGVSVSDGTALVAGGFDAALTHADEWMATRGELGYDVDGAVLKLDDISLHATLGSTGADPNWAVALKFPAQAAVTTLLGIELTVGRTGAVTPVAQLRPVALGGVTIAAATLHNAGAVEKLDLRVGDSVLVQRAGDVIPQVVRALPELRSGAELKWELPTQCPCCGSALHAENAGAPPGGDGSSGGGRARRRGGGGSGDASASTAAAPSGRGGLTLWCRNPGCTAQFSRHAEHFATVCLGKAGVGPQVVSSLLKYRLVDDVADFFDLNEPRLLQLPRVGERRAASLLRGIDAARRMPLAMLLAGLGIGGVGAKTAADLAAEFETAEDLQGASLEQLTAVQGIGGKTAAAILTWFSNDTNRELLQRLRRYGVRCVAEPPPPPPPPSRQQQPEDGAPDVQPAASGGSGRGLRGVEGLHVAVTGTLMVSGMSRGQFKALVEEFGASFMHTISSRTSLLVVGESAGRAKPSKAAELGVKVMTEEEFWDTHGGDV